MLNIPDEVGQSLLINFQPSRSAGHQGIPKALKIEGKNEHTTPTIKIGRDVFAASSSRFAVFTFGRKDAGIKALFS